MVDLPFFVKFVNSLHISNEEMQTDYLDDAAYISRRAREWGFTDAELELDLISLKDLRSAIRSILLAASRGRTVNDQDFEQVNKAIQPDVRLFELLADKENLVAAQITQQNNFKPHEFLAHDFARSVSQYGVKRFKLCANDACLWAFHDTSKNGLKKWCSSAACGNTDKVRRFRERKKLAT